MLQACLTSVTIIIMLTCIDVHSTVVCVVLYHHHHHHHYQVTHLHPGDHFGDTALLYDEPRTATVLGVGNVDVLFLTKRDFEHTRQLSLQLVLGKVPLLAGLADSERQAIAHHLR